MVETTDDSFRSVLDSKLPVLVDVWAPLFVRSSTGGDTRSEKSAPPVIERRGRRWIFGSFLLCPCHLPLTLAIVISLAGGTVVGGLLRDHVVVAGLAISFGWVVGTANGFRLVRHAQRGTCPVPWRARRRSAARKPPT